MKRKIAHLRVTQLCRPYRARPESAIFSGTYVEDPDGNVLRLGSEPLK